MKLFLKIFRWIIFGFIVFIALGALLNGGLGLISAVLIAMSGLLIMPIPFMFQLRRKFKLNRIISIILVAVLFVLGILLIPSNNSQTSTNNSQVSSTISNNSIFSNNETSSKENISSTNNNSATNNSSSNIPSSNNSSKKDSSDKNSSTDKPSTTNSSQVDSSPAKPTHTHSYIAATCTSPKTCSTCGVTSGSAKGHSWMDATYSSPKKCSVCGSTQGEALTVPNSENYHGHVYTGGSSSKKYHYEAQCAGKNSHEITWDDVSKRNLGPCGTCVLK